MSDYRLRNAESMHLVSPQALKFYEWMMRVPTSRMPSAVLETVIASALPEDRADNGLLRSFRSIIHPILGRDGLATQEAQGFSIIQMREVAPGENPEIGPGRDARREFESLWLKIARGVIDAPDQLPQIAQPQ